MKRLPSPSNVFVLSVLHVAHFGPRVRKNCTNLYERTTQKTAPHETFLVVMYFSHLLPFSFYFRLKLYALYVVKNWIYRIGSSFHVNAAIKSACGVGIAFESPNPDFVPHVALLTVMTHTSLAQSMWRRY